MVAIGFFSTDNEMFQSVEMLTPEIHEIQEPFLYAKVFQCKCDSRVDWLTGQSCAEPEEHMYRPTHPRVTHSLTLHMNRFTSAREHMFM